MGNCYAKHKNRRDVIDTQNIKSINNTYATNATIDQSRQNQEEIMPYQKLGSTAFHAHPNDFVRNEQVTSENFLNDYEILNEIATGSYGKVVKARDKRTNQLRAVKIVRKDMITSGSIENLLEIWRILIALDHPNIVKIYGAYEDEYKYYLVSELLAGGELFDRIIANKHLNESGAANVMRQILSAVAYCHRAQIIHRDLKPENLLFDSTNSNNIKIIDFGLAHHLRPHQRANGVTGTSLYMAPECLEGEYDEKCDVWSCGVILYVMLSGYAPFAGDSDEEIFASIKNQSWDFNDTVWRSVSDEGKAFIKKMMTYDPKQRISAQQALQDPWLKHNFRAAPVKNHIAQDQLKRLSSFKSKKKLQEAAWVYLVSVYTSQEDLQNLFETFEALDADSDGQLTKLELKNGYMRIMHMTEDQANKEVEKIFSVVDVNKDGKIDYSEFCSAATSRKRMITEKTLKDCFDTFDRQKRGEIVADDLKSLFNNEIIKRFSPNTWNRWVQEADKNKDGKISFDEFKEMMMNLMEEEAQISRKASICASRKASGAAEMVQVKGQPLPQTGEAIKVL